MKLIINSKGGFRMHIPNTTQQEDDLLFEMLQFFKVFNAHLTALQTREVDDYLNDDHPIMYPDIEHVVNFYQPIVEVSAHKYADAEARTDLNTIESIRQKIKQVDNSFDPGTDLQGGY